MTDIDDVARVATELMEENSMDALTLSQRLRKRLGEIEFEDMDPEAIGNAARKGQGNENQAVDILSGTFGMTKVEKVHAPYGDDPFRVVDVIVLDPDGNAVKFVQVKTNDLSAKDRTNYRRAIERRVPDSVEVEFWVRVDYQGWELYRWDDGFDQFGELPVNKDDAIEAYREMNDYYS